MNGNEIYEENGKIHMAKLQNQWKCLTEFKFKFKPFERKFNIKDINKYTCAELTQTDYSNLLWNIDQVGNKSMAIHQRF